MTPIPFLAAWRAAALAPLLLPALEQPRDAAALREGSWVHAGPESILRERWATTVTFARVPSEVSASPAAAEGDAAEEWTISLRTTHHFGVNTRREPVTTVQGPFPVTVDADKRTLRYRGSGDTWHQKTFAFTDEGVLVMPAIVELRPGAFLYVDDRERWSATCGHDFREVPVGTCRIPYVDGGRGFYAYEETPRDRDSTNGKTSRTLRFLERVVDGGYLIERDALVWDDYGAPRDASQERRIRMWRPGPR